jgi:predicted GIY-YIG superfamily endonuclease
MESLNAGAGHASACGSKTNPLWRKRSRRSKMSETIYVLKLTGGKYYVGKSADVAQRFKQHLSGRGSAWTNMYKPVSIMETRPLTSIHDETNITKDLMKKYGVSNVRGGAYTAVDLPVEQEDMIRHELRASTDACYKCGKPGHFANKCTRKSSFTGTCGCGKSFLDFDEFMSHNRACIARAAGAPRFKGGRQEHAARNCNSRSDSRGDTSSDDGSSDDDDSEEDEEAPRRGACYRCGRPGHYSPDCYAKRHVKGYYLDDSD